MLNLIRIFLTKMQNNHLDFINQINLLKLQFSKIGIQVKSLISVLNVMIVVKMDQLL